MPLDSGSVSRDCARLAWEQAGAADSLARCGASVEGMVGNMKTRAPTFRRRLLKLADFLDALPPERFDFGVWAGDDWKGAPDLSCGTTACALGWATTIPEFARLGLRLVKGRGRAHYVTIGRDHKEDASYSAAYKVFGVTTEEFEYLFLPSFPPRQGT